MAEPEMTKKKEKLFMITGPDDNDPFGGLKKLLGGFCDPHGNDDASVASTAMGSHYHGMSATSAAGGETAGSSTTVNNNGQTYGMGGGTGSFPEGDSLTSKPDPITEEGEEPEISTGMEVALEDVQTMSRELEVENEEEPPVLKASHSGPTARRKRGVEIFLVAALFVVSTIFALHQLGYELDLKVVEINLKSLEQHPHWISFAQSIKTQNKKAAGNEKENSPEVGGAAETTTNNAVNETDITPPVIKERLESSTVKESMKAGDESEGIIDLDESEAAPTIEMNKEQDVPDNQDDIEADIMADIVPDDDDDDDDDEL